MARQAFVVNDAMREKVWYLAGLGVRQDDIAKIIGCAPKTLRKCFRDELDRGVAEANATIAGSLFLAAKAGHIAAMIFWLKTRANWREVTAPVDAVTGTEAGSNSNVILVLPDNSRDPELTQILHDAQQKYFKDQRRQRARPGSNLMGYGEISGPTETPAQAEYTPRILPDNGRDALSCDNGRGASTPGG